MTPKQKIEIRRSEIRARLGEIAGLEGDALTEKIGEERGKLMTELTASEPQLQAAIAAEETETRHRGNQADGDGGKAEIRGLHGKASAGAFINEALTGIPAKDGSAEAEYRAAVLKEGEDRPGRMPLRLLAPADAPDTRRLVERRADVATAIGASDVPAMTLSWVDRVFADSDAMFIGAMFESVSTGDALYPVVSAGASGAAAADGVATDAVAATITVNSLKPHQLRARYLFHRTDDLRLAGLEEALRRDLAGTLREGLDSKVFNGTDSATEPEGLFEALAVPADPDALSGWEDLVGALTSAVDGRYASNLMDVAAVVGAATFKLASTTVSASIAIGPISDYLATRSRGYRTSVHVPAPAGANEIQTSIVAKQGRGLDSLKVPVWDALDFIRDEVTQAATGQIAVTALMFYNSKVLRADAFQQVKFRLAAA